MCHLAIEKTLKGLWAETQAEYPPRTHDLLLLVRRLGLAPPKRDLRFLGFITEASFRRAIRRI
jgi:HEPN domain-containing protein